MAGPSISVPRTKQIASVDGCIIHLLQPYPDSLGRSMEVNV